MAKYEKRFVGEFEQVVDILHNEILKGGLTMNLVDQNDYENNGIRVAIRVYDKYFMRNSSRACLNVTVVETGKAGELYVSAIAAGGGQGLIFNTSFGAESEMVELVQNCLESQHV